MQAAVTAAPAIYAVGKRVAQAIRNRRKGKQQPRLGRRIRAIAQRYFRPAPPPRRKARNRVKNPSYNRIVSVRPRGGRTETQSIVEVAATASQPDFEVESYSKSGNQVVVVGHEAVGNVSLNSDVSAGTIMVTIPLMPSSFPKASLYNNMYSSFRFLEAKLFYVPGISAANANANGMLQLCYQADPDEQTPATSYASVNETYSWRNSRETAVYACVDIAMPNTKTQRQYYTDPSGSDARLTQQGRFYVRSATPLTGGSLFGRLYVSYRIAFATPHTEGFTGLVGGKINSGGTLSIANPLGTAPTLDSASNGIVANTNNTWYLRYPGQYQITSVVNGTGLTTPALPTITGPGTLTNVVSAVGTSTQWTATQILVCVSDTFVINGFSAGAGTITNAFVLIARAPLNSLAITESPSSKLEKITQNILCLDDEQINLILSRLRSAKLKESETEKRAPTVSVQKFYEAF